MICPHCKVESSSLVWDSKFKYFKWTNINARRRTHKCSCGKKFITLELTTNDITELLNNRSHDLARLAELTQKERKSETTINS